MNIPPAWGGRQDLPVAAKALQARRAGGERSWNAGGDLGQLRSLFFSPPPPNSAPPGGQVSDQCPLKSFSVLLVSNSLRSKRWTSWWGCGRMWEVRYLESGFGILPVFERIASEFWEGPPQADCFGQGLGGGGRKGRRRLGWTEAEVNVIPGGQ